MSDLVLKIPKGKLPFIGITYDLSYHNAKENEDLINKREYKGAEYSLTLEFIKDKINIKLICEEHLIIRRYYGIKFNPEKVQIWRELIKGKTEFNFGHVTRVNSVDTIMKTNVTFRPIVFRVTKLEMLSPDEAISFSNSRY